MSVTTSEVRTWQRCREEWRLSYALGFRPRIDEAPLRFGKLIHLGLEAYWSRRDWARALDAGEALDDYERAKAKAMLTGYVLQWGDEDRRLEVLGVEKTFALPRDGFVLAGRFDVLVKDERGRTYIVEHKTSTQDISPGSDYWRQLTVDDQVSNYHHGARGLGHEVSGCIYDVLRTPDMEPRRATPVEKRKFTKAGALYATQREEDESVGDYQARVTEAVLADLRGYYQRGEIVRLESEEQRSRDELRTLALEIVRAESDPVKPQPRNPGSCKRYGRACSFLPLCAGETDLFDVRYRKATAKHEELL